TGLVLVTLTLRKPAAARHRGGCWDLGDPGSVIFRDLGVHAALSGDAASTLSWVSEQGQNLQRRIATRIDIYQDSSGGENWRSRNHVNRHGRVPLTFRGYRVRVDGADMAEGFRASPVMSLTTAEVRLSGAIEQFWENFPKSLEGERGALTLGLNARIAPVTHGLRWTSTRQTNEAFPCQRPWATSVVLRTLRW